MENNISSYIREKAEYCLNCKAKPCSNKGCPLNNNIPEFIQCIKDEEYEKAYQIVTKTTVLPSICGRICPHQKQCQGSCVRGLKGKSVDIGDLETFIGDIALENNYKIKKEIDKNIQSNKIAIIGGGPAGLTAAAFLARTGAEVTIYEKYDYLGGILVHGIPDFRLSKDIVKKSIEKILELGIKVKNNQEIGKNLFLDDLENEYDKVILAFGANTSLKMGIEGENLKGVFGGNELLEYNLHPNYEGKTVLINGGGNVAIDVARTVKKLGAKDVIIVYRRSKEQMPAEDKEVQNAENEGIKFLLKNNLVKIIGDKNNQVKSVELIKTELIKKEGDDRLSPIDIYNSNYVIDVDYVIMAIGSHTDDFIKDMNLEKDKYGNIKIDENYRTSNSKVYAVGDLAGIRKTVAWAAYSGREVAKMIKRDTLK